MPLTQLTALRGERSCSCAASLTAVHTVSSRLYTQTPPCGLHCGGRGGTSEGSAARSITHCPRGASTSSMGRRPPRGPRCAAARPRHSPDGRLRGVERPTSPWRATSAPRAPGVLRTPTWPPPGDGEGASEVVSPNDSTGPPCPLPDLGVRRPGAGTIRGGLWPRCVPVPEGCAVPGRPQSGAGSGVPSGGRGAHGHLDLARPQLGAVPQRPASAGSNAKRAVPAPPPATSAMRTAPVAAWWRSLEPGSKVWRSLGSSRVSPEVFAVYAVSAPPPVTPAGRAAAAAAR